MTRRLASLGCALLSWWGCSSPLEPRSAGMPAPGTPPDPATVAVQPPPSPAPSQGAAPSERRGEGIDLVHVICTLDARSKPMRSSCAEAPSDAPRPHNLTKCDRLTRRPATPSTMAALSSAWEAAAPRVSNGGQPLKLGATVITPSGLPRPDSATGRPTLMVVEMRLLGKRHSQFRETGCDNPPPNMGCDPVSVGHGPLIPAEAKGEVQMVSEGFGGVGRCTGPLP